MLNKRVVKSTKERGKKSQTAKQGTCSGNGGLTGKKRVQLGKHCFGKRFVLRNLGGGRNWGGKVFFREEEKG